MQVVDAHIVSRRLTQAKCRGDTMRDNQTNICVQHCHELCDPFQGIPFLFRSFFFFFFFFANLTGNFFVTITNIPLVRKKNQSCLYINLVLFY